MGNVIAELRLAPVEPNTFGEGLLRSILDGKDRLAAHLNKLIMQDFKKVRTLGR